jgi:hypothetical protein
MARLRHASTIAPYGTFVSHRKAAAVEIDFERTISVWPKGKKTEIEFAQEIGGHGTSQATASLVDHTSFKTGAARSDLDEAVEGAAWVDAKAGRAPDAVASRTHRQFSSHPVAR